MTFARREVLGELLDAPGLSAAVLGAGAAHIGLCAAGLGGWPCPIYLATGWPCPGCGLGRACVLLLRGEWGQSLRVHAFAPVLLFTLALLGAGLLLRGRAGIALRSMVNRFEKQGHLAGILLGAFLFYWASRLLLDGEYFRLLVG